MTLDIRARCELTRDDAAHAERTLRFALGRFGHRVARTRVTLVDLNGPRGGIDKSCAIDVRGDGVTVHVEERAATVREALSFAAARAGRAVARAVHRARPRSEIPRLPSTKAPSAPSRIER